MSNWRANVPLVVDGTSVVDQSTINGITDVLAGRDQYLFEMLNDKSDKTVLISYNQPIAENLAAGTPVYFDTSGGQPVLRAAKCGYNPNTGPHLVPQQSAFVFGVIASIYDGPSNPIMYGDIYVKGLLTDFNPPLDTESNEEGALNPGPLYLSTKEAGKLTIFPSGAAIFVGYYLGDTKFVLSPTVDSLNQLYFNYRLFLKPQAAGNSVNTIDTTWSITHEISAANDAENRVGWLTAADATSVFGITPPAGAKFYYSLPATTVINDTTEDTNEPYYLTSQQKKDAILLKSALPAYPAAYTMVFMNGVLQIAYDADHTDGAYIIDDNGIWWMHDQAGEVPWSGSPDEVNLLLLITKLNPNFSDSIVTSLESANSAIQITGAAGQQAESGDLLVKLMLPIQQLEATSAGTAVQDITYSPSTGITTAHKVSVVNNVVGGPGVIVNNDTPGKVIISLSNFSLSSDVTDIEPEEADFVYKGLHSYLRLKNPPANQKLGFVGKFKVPDGVSSGLNIAIRLNCFCDSAQASSYNMVFNFEYATSNTNSVISSAINSSTIEVPGTELPSMRQVLIYKNLSNLPYFTIPSANFSAGSYVNFRISRVNGDNTAPLGVLGVNWIIE